MHSTIIHQLGILEFHRATCGDPESDTLYKTGIEELFDNGYAISGSRHMYLSYVGSILCKLNNNVIAGIFYKEDNIHVHNKLIIPLTYVQRDYRKNGLFVLLHKQIDIMLAERGLSGCLSWQSVNNEIMSHARDSVGYKPVMVLYERKLSNGI